MKAARLLGMEIDELAGRARQEASKLIEQAGGLAWGKRPSAARPARPARGERPSIRPSCGESGVSMTRSGAFFRGAASAALPALLEGASPAGRDPILEAADSICRGRFDLMGHRALWFGDPIDWHLDPTSGRRSPFVHWSRLDPLDGAAVGDVKVVWELGRHQWLIPLGQAWRLSGDERYASAAADRLGRWIDANPRGMGIHWASSLEVSLRLISWCWAVFLMKGSAAWPERFLARIEAEIEAHAAHVEKYLSRWSSPNTHLTGEALGLFYAGAILGPSRRSRRWRLLGSSLLDRESLEQILHDGVHFERSTCYQRYTAEIYLHYLILASLNGIHVPSHVGRRLQKALDFLMSVRWPAGEMPSLGDSDGGSLLPLASRGEGDLRALFSTAAAFFGREDYAWAAGALAPETLWLLGPGGADAFHGIRPAPPARDPSAIFPEGGYAVMRSGWEQDAHQAIFDAGPLGCPVSAGHGHAGLLAVDLALFGRACLVDPGTCVYAADPSWRDYFRSTAAHSTVLVDRTPQARPAGPFRWRSRPEARLLRWISTAETDYADARHDAYLCLPDPVVHRRRLLFVKPRFWVIVDDLEGASEHDIDVRFQLAPMAVKIAGSGWVRAAASPGTALFLRAFSEAAFRAEVLEGETAPGAGWVSPAYGVRMPAPAISWSSRVRLPVRIATLLWPSRGDAQDPPDARPLFSSGPALSGIDIGPGLGRIAIDSREIAFRRG